MFGGTGALVAPKLFEDSLAIGKLRGDELFATSGWIDFPNRVGRMASHDGMTYIYDEAGHLMAGIKHMGKKRA